MPSPLLPRLFRAVVLSLAMLAWAPLLIGCAARQAKIPGESDIQVSKLEIENAEKGEELKLETEELLPRLGMRKGALTSIAGYYSTFREAEDRRRIAAYWQQFGYFDVDVSEPELTFTPDHTSVAVKYKVKEGQRYKVGKLELKGFIPPEEKEAVEQLIPFTTGETRIDLEAFRKVRNVEADFLRAEGFAHANCSSRFYIDKPAKEIHVFYFFDAGPRAHIASISVAGNKRVPAETIIRRSGVHVGDPYKEGMRDQVVRDLLDSGSFAAAFVRVDADTTFIPPGTTPDPGGVLKDEQIDANGELIARKLPDGINIVIHVVEAPRVTFKLRGSFEIDPSRADALLGASVFLRDLFAPLNHLVVEGSLGYGLLIDDPVNQRPTGIYGEALIRSIHSGALGRLGDLRITAHYKSDLFPDFYLHHFEGGPGVRTNFAAGFFLDVDIFAKYARSIGFGPFSAEEVTDLRLPTDENDYGAELQAQLVYDHRDNLIEAMRGYLFSFRTKFSPGKPLNTNRYLDVSPEARVFIPLGNKLSVALRATGDWVFLSDGAGVPLDVRLFGGGAYGMRGFGRQELSPLVSRCAALGKDVFCRSYPVGGLSLVESTAELRFLPLQKPYGANVFVDFGGASGDENPFANGPSFDAGIGVRLRLWYLPANVDVAYAVLRNGEVQGIHDSPVEAFFRIGEAF